MLVCVCQGVRSGGAMNRKRRAIRKQRRRRAERREDREFMVWVDRMFAPFTRMFDADLRRFVGGP